MNSLYSPSSIEKQKFDISVPRASYISHAFIEFVKDGIEAYEKTISDAIRILKK